MESFFCLSVCLFAGFAHHLSLKNVLPLSDPPRRSLHSRQTHCLFAARCTLTRRREIPRAHATSYRGAPPEPRKVTDERLTRAGKKWGGEKTLFVAVICNFYTSCCRETFPNCSRGGKHPRFLYKPLQPPPPVARTHRAAQSF